MQNDDAGAEIHHLPGKLPFHKVVKCVMRCVGQIIACGRVDEREYINQKQTGELIVFLQQPINNGDGHI